MRKIIFLIIFVVLSSMLLLSQAYATDYYVRPSGNSYGSGNGTSYANAWSGISNINWSTVDSGNGILWIDGTHTQSMTVGADGESGAPIYIKAYSGSASLQGINTSGRSYVTIDGLTVQNSSGDGISFHASNNITIMNCTVTNNVVNGLTGYSDSNVGSNILIDGNTIYHNGSTTGIAAGIFFKGESIIIRNNKIYNNGYNSSASDKSHGIYIDQCTSSAEIYNNIVHDNHKGSGIKSKANLTAYNNITYGNNWFGIQGGENGSCNSVVIYHHNVAYQNGATGLANTSKGSGSLNATYYNNSTYENGTRSSGSWYGEVLVENSLTSLDMRDNIFYGDSKEGTLSIASQSNATYDYNIVYGSGAQSQYQGPNGAYANPQYVSPPSNMQLQSGSPGIAMNAGAYASGSISPSPSPPPSPPPPPPPPTGLVPAPPSIIGVE